MANERTGGYSGMAYDNVSMNTPTPAATLQDQIRLITDELNKPGNSPQDVAGLKRELARLGANPIPQTKAIEPEVPQGALSQIDPANPWGMNDAVGNYGAAEPQPEQPAQPQPGALTRAHAAPDMQAMLAQYMPQDNSQSKYLALAAGFGAATKTGSFGESLGNVASALQDQKVQQEKLRSQYVPLIMQQVAAQQARDEQAQYRAEAQKTAIAAQKEAAKLLAENRAHNDEQNRLTRESISAERLAAAQAAKDAKPDPIPHVVTTPDGVFTLGRDGKPVRMNDPATGLPLTGKETSDIPKLKPGEKWNPDTQKAEAIVGSDLYQKQASAHAKDYAALSSVNTQMDSSISKVNEILDPKKTDEFNSNFGGYNALITQYFPGDAADMKKRIEGVKSDLKMAGLNMMRAGGGIGAMTEKEWPIVEAMVAKIDPRLSEEEARLEFGKVIAYMSRIKENANTTYGMEWADSPHSRKTLGAAPASSAMPSQGGPTPVQSLVDKYRSK